jgi:U2 small nuclear ribonucleoprotein A'
MRLTPNLIRSAPSYLNPLKQRELSLRGFQIAVIENLGVTGDIYEVIDFSDNELVKLDNIPCLKRLNTILASNNRLTSVTPGLGAALPALDSLVLAYNHISTIAGLAALSELPTLTSLIITGNPVTATVSNYREVVAALLPKLRVLDSAPITTHERAQAKAIAARLAQGAPLAAFALVRAGDGQLMSAEPAESATPVEAAPVRATLTREQKMKLALLLEAATTAQEMAVIEQILKTGAVPEGFDLK